MMNVSDWPSLGLNTSYSAVTSAAPLLPLGIPSQSDISVSGGYDNSPDVTEMSSVGVTSDKPCGEVASVAAAATARLPGSLDALLYIVIVLVFYAFSIVILMVKYIRREREEANLRNYYHEFVSRDKFRTAQYKNRQFMSRIFGRATNRTKQESLSIEDEESQDSLGPKPGPPEAKRCRGIAQSVARKGTTFSRLVFEEDEETSPTLRDKESFTFLSAKNQFCKNGFFGKKFCNKQLCSKCVSESAPSIDWGDGKGAVESGRPNSNDMIEVTIHNACHTRPAIELHKSSQRTQLVHNRQPRLSIDTDSHIFYPIIECDFEKDLVESPAPPRTGYFKNNALTSQGNVGQYESIPLRPDYATQAELEEHALVSSCSLEVSELLANMPPLGKGETSIDMDTLDGLSNLDSEAESQSLLNYSTSLRGLDSRSPIFSSVDQQDSRSRRSPQKHCGRVSINRSTASSRTESRNNCAKTEDIEDERAKELLDALSERTSLLSCTLSIAGEDDDVITNMSSSKYPLNGFHHSSTGSNGKIKPEFKCNGKTDFKANGRTDFKANGKSLLNSLSKSISSEEDDVIKLLNDITLLTEDSGVFRNLKYFLRSFSRNESDRESPHEKSNLLPKETYFGPDSPHSVSASAQSETESKVDQSEELDYFPSQPPSESGDFSDDLINTQDIGSSSEKDYGNRWAYTYDEDDDIFSDKSSSIGERSSSFGDYCMGQTTDSQIIDISGPLARRQLDPVTKAGLSRAIIGLEGTFRDDPDDPPPAHNKTNPMVAGYGPARKETKV